MHELILGGQRSGKSRRAEQGAADWLAASAQHQAVFIATAQAGDAEMAGRIARHRADRADRLPRLRTVEEPLALGAAITQHSAADTLVVVDCLTLWLTNCLMPIQAEKMPFLHDSIEFIALFLEALTAAKGPVLLVSNEIGLGVIPLGAEVRAFVDALGRLNQDVAQLCTRVTLMAAGLPLRLKGQP
ncbi:MAG: hypothetical protein RLZZ401_966 [Pseudomonadota bacterium]|jgi:adenosylcobinamide kinase/adenosylcobinamide-phosphate guanylyltransferase